MTTSSSGITHAFNGSFSIAGYQDWSAPNPYEAFSIYLNGLPKEACIKLATMDWGSGSSSGLVSVSVNNGYCFSCDDGYVGCQGTVNQDTTTACPGGTVLSVPMPITAATTACSGSNPQLTIKFK